MNEHFLKAFEINSGWALSLHHFRLILVVVLYVVTRILIIFFFSIGNILLFHIDILRIFRLLKVGRFAVWTFSPSVFTAHV